MQKMGQKKTFLQFLGHPNEKKGCKKMKFKANRQHLFNIFNFQYSDIFYNFENYYQTFIENVIAKVCHNIQE